jgi:hypothetical protein
MKVGTRDFSLEPHHNLEIRSTASTKTDELQNEHIIYRFNDGRELSGNSAVIRGAIENIAHAEIWNGYLSISFSPATIKSKGVHNMDTVNRQDFNATCEEVEVRLKESGVNVSVDNCHLKRIDVARDREMLHSFQNYTAVFHSLHFARQDNRDYPTTYLAGNKQQATCIYDKLESCRAKGMNIPENYQKSINLIRCEYRMLTRKKIEQSIHLSKIGELKSSFDVLETFYNRQIKSAFNYQENMETITPSETVLGTELEKIFALKKYGQRNVVGNYLEMCGIERITSVFGDLDTFLKIIVDKRLLSRQNAFQLKKKYTEISQVFGRMEPDSLPGLLCELVDQFLKAA